MTDEELVWAIWTELIGEYANSTKVPDAEDCAPLTTALVECFHLCQKSKDPALKQAAEEVNRVFGGKS